MLDKLSGIESRYEELTRRLSEPDIFKDQEKFRTLSKEHADLRPIMEKFGDLKRVLQDIATNKGFLRDSDSELKELAQGELDELIPRREELEEELRFMLLPQDPNDSKNCIIEIRAGTGGDEASLFAADLFRMYERYFDIKGWKQEILSSTESESGGFKEVIFSAKGKDVFGEMKYESGVHRVQRVPVTESQGRVHTSAATVAVLPEAEEVDIQIKPEDLRIDVFRSSGPGGQSVNTTDSAVRVTHIPTGLVVQCQDEKSQHKNRDKAVKVLRSRLMKLETEARDKEISESRRSMVSTGDRSAKIRTYNYPQGRVTDHRISLTLYRLPEILNGDISELIEALRIADNSERLQAVEA